MKFLATTMLCTAFLLGNLTPSRAADETVIPPRHAVISTGMDFYGGDIRDIRDTTQAYCEAACLDDLSCRAFTFNTRAGACFLKTDVSEMKPYKAAVSGQIVAVGPATLAEGEARANRLDMLSAGEIAVARALALSIGTMFPANLTRPEDLTPPRGEPMQLGEPNAARLVVGRRAALTDASADWLELSRLARKTGNAQEAMSAAINAYLRAEDTERVALALNRIALLLEDRGQGRTAIPVLRLAAELAPGPEASEDLARVLGLYGFNVAEHRVESDSAEPRVCVTFNEKLAAAGVDYATFLRMEGRALPVEVSEADLCISGLLHGETARFTLREGLPSASGETLAASRDIEVYVRDRTPAVRFPGRGYVLPKSLSAAIPVISVNTDKVALRISRIGERSLVPGLRDQIIGNGVTSYSEAFIAGTAGEAVWQGEAVVTRRVNADVTTLMPVGEAVKGFAPGVYVMSARVPGKGEEWENAATQWFVVTDLGLSTLSGNDGLHVFVRALSSAAAQAGVTVRLLAQNNEVLGEAVTDADGYARFAPGLSRGTGGLAPALLTATTAGEDFAYLSLGDAAFDLSDRGVEGRVSPPPVDVFVSTERGAYRPGETVHATILARDALAGAVEGLTLTAILTRPDGVEHSRTVLADQGNGGRVLTLPLLASAQRGTWRLRLHADVGGASLATTSFLVEDFTPERIDFTLSLAEGAALDPAALPPLTVAARYLYGAPGSGLRVEGETVLAGVDTLDAFPGFRFGLADRTPSPAYASLAEGSATDETGALTLDLPVPVFEDPATGLTSLTAVLRLAEGSGRPVERRITRTLAPDGPRIGVRPLFDGVAAEGQTVGFEVIAIGRDLKPLAMPKVGWTLSRLDTEYQWYQLDGRWSYETITKREKIASGDIAVGADLPAKLEAPVRWGEYELTLHGTLGDSPATTSTRFWAGWYAATAGSDTPDRLQVGLDAKAYRPGDTARLRLTARDPGKLLVTVMSDRLIDRRALDVPAGDSVVELPVTADWGAGAYVTATLVRPLDAGAKRNPARAIGLAWAGVDPGAHLLKASFTSAPESDPRGPLVARLKVDGIRPGETAQATIAAVDLGILTLTGFTSPDPAGQYFGQRRLGIEMRDVYGRLIDGLNGEAGTLRQGGDGDLDRSKAPAPTQDLVAYFQGPLTVGPDGMVEASFDIPDFNGTVRLMAVVWSKTGVGQAEQDVLVRDPVVVTTTTPQFLAPGDQSRLLIELAHATGPAGAMQVDVAATQGLRLGPVARTVTLDPLGRASLSVPMTAGAVGEESLTVALTTPDGRRLIRTQRLSVRANDPEIARTHRVEVPAGAELVLGPDLFAGITPGTGRISLALGPLGRFDTAGLLSQLDRYPYGCTEQVTSVAMPLLYLGGVAEAMGLGTRETTRGKIAAAIGQVLARQTGAGSFGLWQPEEGDTWLDAYVTDFLSRARALGHAVPDTAFRVALNNLRNRVNYAQDFETGGEDLAYALMVLAREGAASIGDLRYYADIKASAFATPLAKAQLGLGLAYYGDQPRADAMFRQAAAEITGAAAEEKVWRADYGSLHRDAAAVLTLAIEGKSAAVDREALAGLVRLAEGGRRYLSTQESMWSLLAAHALVEQTADGSIRYDGQPLTDVLVRRMRDSEAPKTIANTGTAPVLATLTTTGVPNEPEPAGGDGYRIERAFYTLDGQPVDLSAIPQSSRLVAVLTVTPERDAQGRLMVEDPLPAGFEIDNPHLLQAGDLAGLAWLDLPDVARHTEFRADRFRAAVDWGGSSAFRLAYRLRALSPGRFHLPAAAVEDMYRPEFRARTAAGEVVVVE